jgi:hypothetical protein
LRRPSNRRTAVGYGEIAKPVLVLATIVAGMTLLGAMSSVMFNVVLQRSDFAQEGVWDYLVWGRRSSFPPFLILLVVLQAVTILKVVRRVLIASFSVARRLDKAVQHSFGQWIHRMHLDESTVLSSYALMISVSVVAISFWYFQPLILALFSRIGTASPDSLALLSPTNVTYHNYYRGIFTGVVIVTAAVWYPVWRLVQKGQSLHWGVWIAGAVVTSVALALLHVPHRLLYFNKTFNAVSWNGAHCYVIGERANDLLLFCPDLPVPRTRVVQGRQSVEPLDVRESIFTRFGDQRSKPPAG